MEEIASSLERIRLYANWSGLSVLGRLVLMLCMTSLSKHFIIGLTAMGWYSFRQDTGDFFGMIVVNLRHVGTTAWLSELLKISVRTSLSCAAQSQYTARYVGVSGISFTTMPALDQFLMVFGLSREALTVLLDLLRSERQHGLGDTTQSRPWCFSSVWPVVHHTEWSPECLTCLVPLHCPPSR